jgi:Lon protease-like protein
VAGGAGSVESLAGTPQASQEAREGLPLFPLRTVLFPGGPLSLRIFEPRYVDMVGHCMREGTPFGVVLIHAGGEVGPVAEMATVGTEARIVDFTTLPDGLLGLSCIGEGIFRVRSRWTLRDGLHMAEVERLPAASPQPVPAEYRGLQQALRCALAEMPELYAGNTPCWEDASWVSFRLAEIVPLPLPARLELLTLRDPLERLSRIAAALPQR